MKTVSPTPWHSQPELEDNFARLDHLLHAFKPVWQPEPFQHPRLPWQDEHPDLVQRLISLSDEELHELQTQPDQLIQFIDRLLQLNSELINLSQASSLSGTLDSVDSAAKRTVLQIPDSLTAGIPGRKWQQIEAFCTHLPSADHYTDWCCGKGHLARLIHFHKQVPVTGLEYNPELCVKGNQLSEKLGLPVDISEQDVLASIKDSELLQRHITALHACGDLHTQLLNHAVQHKSPALTISPCCYHLTANEYYQPLSDALISETPLRLSLTKNDLKLAVQETVTAPKRDQHHRRTLKQWRLAFDLLQRELTGIDHYRACPSVPYSILSQGFDALAERFSQHLGFTLPVSMDTSYYLAAAHTRLAEVERLELVRQGFRRALELWLIHDRALLLAKSGYRVRFGTFCDRSLTPRNLLIQAERV